MGNLLSIQNVSKTYDKHVALNDVSLEIPEKSIFGLLGPNGAGKTTLIRIINQITGPDKGQVFFNGEALKPQHVAEIGYLPEERGLYKKMAVGEQCMYLSQLKGLTKKDAEKHLKTWFDKFEITGWWNKKIEELSKGMQQKVQFIVTVMHQPRLLILDEPFSGFDPINANIIRDEIKELQSKGATVIFSTHNMGSVEELCDHIALINKSQKVLDGSVKQIRKDHRTKTFTVQFRGNFIGFSTGLWTGAEILSKSTDDDINTATIKLLGDTTPNQILQSILPVCEVIAFNELIPSMNDIFIKTVNHQTIYGTQSNFTE